MNATVIQALWGPSTIHHRTENPTHVTSREISIATSQAVRGIWKDADFDLLWRCWQIMMQQPEWSDQNAQNLTHLHFWILALWLLLLSSTIQRMLLVTKSKHLALFVCLYVFLEINICTLFKTRDHYSLLYFWSRPGDKFQGPWRGFKYPISGSGFSDLWHRSQITRRPECLISVPLPDAPVLNLWNKPQCLTSVCSG